VYFNWTSLGLGCSVTANRLGSLRCNVLTWAGHWSPRSIDVSHRVFVHSRVETDGRSAAARGRSVPSLVETGREDKARPSLPLARLRLRRVTVTRRCASGKAAIAAVAGSSSLADGGSSALQLDS
jgi:hypothetical protein